MADWKPGSLALLALADVLLIASDALRLASAPAAADDQARPDASDPNQSTDLAAACGLDPQATASLDQVLVELAARTDATAGEYSRLFEASGCCPPNETAYIRRDKGAILADLCGFYQAFGFAPASGTGEKADHVVTELQFMALLLVLTAQAGAIGERANARIAAEALEAFAADHLGEWLPSFIARLRAVTTMPLLLAAADLLESSWEALALTFDLPSLAIAAPLPPREEQDFATWDCFPPEPDGGAGR